MQDAVTKCYKCLEIKKKEKKEGEFREERGPLTWNQAVTPRLRVLPAPRYEAIRLIGEFLLIIIV